MASEADILPKRFLTNAYLLALIGEGSQSAFHFLLSAALMRTFEPSQYGLFAVVFTVGAIANAYSYAVLGVPAKVFLPQAKPASARALEVQLGSTAAFTSFCIAILVAAGTWLIGSTAGLSVAVGAFVGLWSLRSYVRSALVTRVQRGGALASPLCDALYSVIGVVLVFVFPVLSGEQYTLIGVVSALCCAHAGAIVPWTIRRESSIYLGLHPRALQRFGRLWPSVAWSFATMVASTVHAQSQMLLVTVWEGPAAFAPLAAGFTLVGPLRIVANGLMNVFLPSLAFISPANRRGTLSALAFTMWCLCAFCVAYGAALFLAWPLLSDFLYARQLADAPMGAIVSLSWLALLAVSAYQPLIAVAQQRMNFRSNFVSFVVGGLAGCFCIAAILLSTGPSFTTAGMAAGEFITLICLVIQHRAISRAARPSVRQTRSAKGRSARRP
jgi:O-antigen/teichoic acid export membrane protein